MRVAGCIALLGLVAVGCLPEERPALPDGGILPDAIDPTQPDAIPPADAAPLTEGVAALAGSDEPGLIDGPRNVARFRNPTNVAVDASGNIYVADFENNRVRFVTPDGMVTTLVEQPLFQRPFGLAITRTGVVYVQTDDNDSGEHSIETGTIWRIDRVTGTASPIARNLGRPRGLAALHDGRLVLVDMMHHTVRILNPSNGDIRTIAGKWDEYGMVNGTGTEARFNRPYDVVISGDDFLVSDFDNHCIRRVTPEGVVTTFAGTCSSGFKDGPVSEARFNNPQAMAIDPDGNVYVTDIMNFRIRKIATDGAVTTYAGDGSPGYRDGARMQARFFGLEGHDIGPLGDYLIVADGTRGEAEPHHRIRRITIDYGSLPMSGP